MAGYIIVNVFTARNAIPLQNATVSISEINGGNILSFEHTDGDGLTQSLELQAPPRENSEAPEGGDAFSSYDIRIDYPGYYTRVINNVQIFDGQTSRQNVEMIPLPENTPRDKRLMTNVVTPQNL